MDIEPVEMPILGGPQTTDGGTMLRQEEGSMIASCAICFIGSSRPFDDVLHESIYESFA